MNEKRKENQRSKLEQFDCRVVDWDASAFSIDHLKSPKVQRSISNILTNFLPKFIDLWPLILSDYMKC